MYQQEVADLFRSFGCTAEIEKQVSGIRATHEVDVWVTLSVLGLETKWLVECKSWKSAVPKEKVLALIQIAQDIGADRAFLLSESGFQSGALQAARHTNVTLASIEMLREQAKEDILARSLQSLAQKAHALQQRLHELLIGDYCVLGAPPKADKGLVIELMADVFQAKVISLPHIQAGEFPVHIADTWVLDAEQAVMAITQTLNAIDAQLIEVEAIAAGIYAECRNALDSLMEAAAKVISIGEHALFGAHPDEAAAEQARIDVVYIMKRVGDAADIVKKLVTGQMSGKLNALMRALIDGPYLDLTQPSVERERWDNSCQSVRIALDALYVAARPLTNILSKRLPAGRQG